MQAGQLEVCRVGAPGRRNCPPRALSAVLSTSVPWSDLKYLDHVKMMQCAHQPVPITLQRGTGKVSAGKLYKTVQLHKTSNNFKCNLKHQERLIISSMCFWKNKQEARVMLQGDACLEGVEPPLLEGFRNSCQDFIYS